MPGLTTDLDQMACRLAAQSGVVWHDLNAYPGYLRNQWRAEARELMRMLQSSDADRRDEA